MYVLNVDLWSEDGVKEVNLVRHTSATPSISSTTPASFAQIDEATPAFSPFLPSNRDMPQYPGAPGYSPSVTPYAQGGYTPQAIPPGEFPLSVWPHRCYPPLQPPCLLFLFFFADPVLLAPT